MAKLKGVERRLFVPAFLLGLPLLAETRKALPKVSLRGKLVPGPALETATGKVMLEGDEPTQGVLNDERLRGMDFEVLGKWNGSGRFTVNPIYSRALFVHKDGRRLMVTYWCNVCGIRTYTPGLCSCCQKYTELDLRKPDEPDQ